MLHRSHLISFAVSTLICGLAVTVGRGNSLEKSSSKPAGSSKTIPIPPPQSVQPVIPAALIASFAAQEKASRSLKSILDNYAQVTSCVGERDRIARLFDYLSRLPETQETKQIASAKPQRLAEVDADYRNALQVLIQSILDYERIDGSPAAIDGQIITLHGLQAPLTMPAGAKVTRGDAAGTLNLQIGDEAPILIGKP